MVFAFSAAGGSKTVCTSGIVLGVSSNGLVVLAHVVVLGILLRVFWLIFLVYQCNQRAGHLQSFVYDARGSRG